MADLPELRRRFADFSRTCLPRAPLYSRLGAGVAGDPDVAGLMLAAPAEQHNPPLLFAALHDLVLGGTAPELAAFYPNLTPATVPGDPYPVFRATALAHRDEVRAMLATRHTQTNEVGRCAVLLPLLGLVGAEYGPLALVDVGTSAGLTMCLDRYHYDYEPGGPFGAPSPVELTCGVRGDVPLPVAMPAVAARLGLDSQPIDVTDDDAVRWLEACVWPDQADRFARLRAAIGVAREDPPPIRRGDAVADVAACIDEVAGAGHPVVTTTWMLSYLPVDGQRAFVAELDRVGAGRDLSWIVAESPAQATGLPIPTTAEPEHRTAVSLVRWRGGRRRVERLGTAHPHGYWLHWGHSATPSDAASRPPS